MGSLSLLPGISLTQGSNPGLLNCRRFLYPLNHQASPEWWDGVGKDGREGGALDTGDINRFTCSDGLRRVLRLYP